jgi:hypothetical protein
VIRARHILPQYLVLLHCSSHRLVGRLPNCRSPNRPRVCGPPCKDQSSSTVYGVREPLAAGRTGSAADSRCFGGCEIRVRLPDAIDLAGDGD